MSSLKLNTTQYLVCFICGSEMEKHQDRKLRVCTLCSPLYKTIAREISKCEIECIGCKRIIASEVCYCAECSSKVSTKSYLDYPFVKGCQINR